MGQIICDIQRNATEIIRIEVSDYKGHELINMRIWYSAISPNGDYEYRPTQKGFALSTDKFAELKDAVLKLEQFFIDRKQGIQPEQFAETQTEDPVGDELDDEPE